MTPPFRHQPGQPAPAGYGRFAPSPSGRLHVGNLRTALIAWLVARDSGRELLLRFEDLDRDRCNPETASEQEQDLLSIGITWTGDPVFQSHRDDLYGRALESLKGRGTEVYPCWCSRADLAAAAPHDPQRPYPGTCRDLSSAERAERLRASDRKPAWRASLKDLEVEWEDMVLGPQKGNASDPIVQRADGAFTYNLAVVVDDWSQSVDQVVRGDDLAASVPTQAAIYDALGAPRPAWCHVPLVVDPDGKRLSKRDGSTTLEAWGSNGTALAQLGASLGLCRPDETEVTAEDLLSGFSVESIPRKPWVFEPS